MKSDIRDVTLLPRGITHNCEELEAIFTSRKELAAQFLNHRFPPLASSSCSVHSEEGQAKLLKNTFISKYQLNKIPLLTCYKDN